MYKLSLNGRDKPGRYYDTELQLVPDKPTAAAAAAAAGGSGQASAAAAAASKKEAEMESAGQRTLRSSKS